jgi:hypothetical protein
VVVAGAAAALHPAELVRRADGAAAAQGDGLRLASGELAGDDVIGVEVAQGRPASPGRAEAVAGALAERLDAPPDHAHPSARRGGAPDDAEQRGPRRRRVGLDAALLAHPEGHALRRVGEVGGDEAAVLGAVERHQADAAAEVGLLDGLGHRLLEDGGGRVGQVEVEGGHGGSFGRMLPLVVSMPGGVGGC